MGGGGGGACILGPRRGRKFTHLGLNKKTAGGGGGGGSGRIHTYWVPEEGKEYTHPGLYGLRRGESINHWFQQKGENIRILGPRKGEIIRILSHIAHILGQIRKRGEENPYILGPRRRERIYASGSHGLRRGESINHWSQNKGENSHPETHSLKSENPYILGHRRRERIHVSWVTRTK